MSEREKFLERWSRLKQAADAPSHEEARAADADPAGAPVAAQQPAVDLSSLPSLDSIGADTDVSMFMRPGVPAALRHAALRRAWAADPAIRDFRGLQENGWDFTAPDGVPGFGQFSSDDEIRQLAQRLFGGGPEGERVPQLPPARMPIEAAEEVRAAPGGMIDKNQNTAPAPDEIAASNERATVERHDTSAMVEPKARRHGGALPQ